MKRIFIALMLCMVSVMCFGQEWDCIRHDIGNSDSVVLENNIYRIYRIDIIRDTIPITKAMNLYESYNKPYIRVEAGTPLDLMCAKDSAYHLVHRYYVQKYNYTKVPQQNSFIPKPILERYKYGNKLMNCGWINFSIGSVLTIVGGAVYGSGVKQNKINEVKSGITLLSVGGTFIGISIPLLCFGDNAKRQTNTDYETFNILWNDKSIIK